MENKRNRLGSKMKNFKRTFSALTNNENINAEGIHKFIKMMEIETSNSIEYNSKHQTDLKEIITQNSQLNASSLRLNENILKEFRNTQANVCKKK
jgi:hypothetical protein